MVPAFVFVMTLFLIYLCVIHGFLGLFEYGYYATTLVLFGVFSMLFILWIAAFCNLVFGDAGSMEQEQRLCKGECRVRCIQCGVMKPLRAHHCSKCHTCFAKMDHHCDALGVCVALRNNKVFVVFLAYSIGMLFIYAGSCAAMIFIDQWESFPHLLLMDALTGGTLGVIVSALLAEQIYHTHSKEIENLVHGYIDASLKALIKHSSLMWDETQIITYLTQENPDFGKSIAYIIHDELRYLRQDAKEILEQFKYTKEFLSYFHLDLMKDKPSIKEKE